MQTRMFRFVCKLVLVGAILFCAGTILFTQHTEIIAGPKAAYAAMPDLTILPQQQYLYDSVACLKQLYENARESDVSDTVISSPIPPANPEKNGHDFDTPDTIISNNNTESIENDESASYLQQEQVLSAEQFSNGMDSSEIAYDESIDSTGDTNITDWPEEPMLTRIQTKIKYVETILRKAVIKPYQINGQIEGLQITGLEKILVAKELLLKSGDIIRSVNGHALSSKKRAYDIFKKARKLPMMEIELLRDGKTTTLLYCLK